MKKIALIIAAALCILLFAGCAQSGKAPSDTTQSQSSSASSTSDATEKTPGTAKAESTELDFLRSSISEKSCMLGVGFFGYVDSESDGSAVAKYVADSKLAKSYPFLSDITPVLSEGAELYALVPASSDTAVTVYRVILSEDGSDRIDRDTPIYSGKPGEAVILRCNISEIYSNVLISVTQGESTTEFRPAISLKDGHTVQHSGCYDFSVYNENEEMSYETALEILLENDGVLKATEKGMKLMYTGDTQTVDGHRCLIFALGTDSENQFVRERLYAVSVSDSLIYAYSPETDSWETLKTDNIN